MTTKKNLQHVKKKLKADLDDIQPRIDQTTRLMPVEADIQQLKPRLQASTNRLPLLICRCPTDQRAIRFQYDAIQGKAEGNQ